MSRLDDVTFADFSEKQSVGRTESNIICALKAKQHRIFENCEKKNAACQLDSVAGFEPECEVNRLNGWISGFGHLWASLKPQLLFLCRNTHDMICTLANA